MKFSVTIPAYKSQFLYDAVESVLAQTYEDWELIIVDDCSPENLYSIIESLLEDSRIHYFRNNQNCGAENVVDNWNICLGYCTGDYVICMGDDDRFKPNCLEEYAKIISKYPGLKVYHARTEIIDENGNPLFMQEERPEWESAISLLWNRWDHRVNQYIGDFCYEMSQLRAEGGYYKLPLAWGSDDVTAVRAASLKGIANTQLPIFEYRQNSRTITSSKYGRMKANATRLAFQWFDSFIKDIYKGELGEADRKMLNTIQPLRNRYVRLSIGRNCIDDLCGNPIRLIYWYKQLRTNGIASIWLIRWYLRSVFNLIVK